MIEDVLMFHTFAGLFIFLMIWITLIEFITPRKSKKYRKEIADMYVASKTKKLATEEGLNLNEEYESFKKWLKKQKLENSDLDNVIEGELMEKVQEQKEKKK